MTHTPHLSLPQLQKLASPIHPGRVSQRDGMSYVEAYDVKATLIRIFGYGGFSSELIDSELLFREQVPQARNKDRMNWKVAMKATVRLTIHALNNATYTEAAVAGSSQPDITESMDMALKSAESDALKRAAIFLGDQFGLSLYNDGSTNQLITRIVAPEQQWPPVNPQTEPGERPASAGASVAHMRGEGVTPEQHAQNVDLLNQALSAKKKQQEHRAGYDVPVALDPSIDAAPDTRGLIDNGDHEEAMAAADGHH